MAGLRHSVNTICPVTQSDVRWPSHLRCCVTPMDKAHLPCIIPGKGYPNSKVHGANIGPIWGRQDPGGPHVGPMNFAIWVVGLAWTKWCVRKSCQCSALVAHWISLEQHQHVFLFSIIFQHWEGTGNTSISVNLFPWKTATRLSCLCILCNIVNAMTADDMQRPG